MSYAARAAEIFLDRLIRMGRPRRLPSVRCTSACAEALFAAAQKRGMAFVTGKTMMDRNAPARVLNDAETSARDSEALYRTWHGKGRLRYAVTPRFVVTSSDRELRLAAELAEDTAWRLDADASVRKRLARSRW